MKVPTSDITVGDRVRQNIDEGISDLCNSIRELGQLQPVLVDNEFNLIAGARRLRACEILGIEVAICTCNGLDDVLRKLKAERDENTCRKAFTPSEGVQIGKLLEVLEKKLAEDRMKAGHNQHTEPSDKLPEPSKGNTRDKVAEALGVSGSTYEKAKAVVKAAEDKSLPEPVREVAREAVKQMDATGKVDPSYKAVKAVTSHGPVTTKPTWSVLDDIGQFRRLIERLRGNWSNEADRASLRQFFLQLANEV